MLGRIASFSSSISLAIGQLILFFRASLRATKAFLSPGAFAPGRATRGLVARVLGALRAPPKGPLAGRGVSYVFSNSEYRDLFFLICPPALRFNSLLKVFFSRFALVLRFVTPALLLLPLKLLYV